MSAIEKFARRHWAPMQAVAVAIVAYGSGVIVNLVTVKPNGSADFWILLIGGLVVCVVMTLISVTISGFFHASQERLRREYNTHRSGYQTLNREISEYIHLIRRFSDTNAEITGAPLQLMKNACKDLYDTFEVEYGIGVSVSEHIEFEVTFMTKSVTDGAITVAAWANRDARAPKSLARRQHDQNTYVGTETDKLYQDPNRSPRFISSTVTQDYKELYSGQKTRIRSSIIYPVVDDQSTLMGTLVVHCDRENFFRADADKLWRELLEPYTKRLALARVLADRFRDNSISISF